MFGVDVLMRCVGEGIACLPNLCLFLHESWRGAVFVYVLTCTTPIMRVGGIRLTCRCVKQLGLLGCGIPDIEAFIEGQNVLANVWCNGRLKRRVLYAETCWKHRVTHSHNDNIYICSPLYVCKKGSSHDILLVQCVCYWNRMSTYIIKVAKTLQTLVLELICRGPLILFTVMIHTSTKKRVTEYNSCKILVDRFCRTV